MSDPLAKLDEKTDALRKAAEEVQEATRDARAATKDLRQAQKDLADLYDGVHALMAVEARTIVVEAIDEAVKVGLEQYGDTVKEAMDLAVAKVTSEFESLAAIYMDGEDGRGNIHELAMTSKRLRKAAQR